MKICTRFLSRQFCESRLLFFKGIFWIGIFSIVVMGCGIYSFSGSLAPHLKTVAVPLFEDNTAEFGVKEAITDAIIDEFTADNTLKIADLRDADCAIHGTIVRISDRHGAFTAQEQVQEVKVYITVNVKFEDLKKRQVIWEERISEWGAFDPGDFANRQLAIEDAIQKIASDVLNKVVSAW